MARRTSIYTAEDSEMDHARRLILANRLRRVLPAFARRLGLDPDLVLHLAERSSCLCATCLGSVPVPRLYYVGGAPRAILCGPCSNAIEKTGGDIMALHRHARFDPRYLRNRPRIGRLVGLHSDN